MTKKLKELLERAEGWPEAAQEELLSVAQEIEVGQGEYNATPAELRAVDEALTSLDMGIFATDEEIKAAFANFRRA